MLEMFSEKSTRPIPKFTYHSKRIQKAKVGQEAVPTKKKEKRTLEMFLEKLLTTSSPFYLTSMIQKAVPKPFLQKRKKKNVSNVLKETPPIYLTPIPKLTILNLGKERKRKKKKEKVRKRKKKGKVKEKNERRE